MGKEALISLLKESIASRDLKSLAQCLDDSSKSSGKQQTHYLLRTEVLLSLPSKDQEWFWRSSMPRSKYLRMTELIYATAIKILVKKGFLPGKAFSSRMTQSGRRLLLVTQEVFFVLKDALPKERHSALNLVLKVPKEVTSDECIESSNFNLNQ